MKNGDFLLHFISQQESEVLPLFLLKSTSNYFIFHLNFMRGVHTPGYSRSWMYAIAGKMVGINADIPLGTVLIQTY